MTVTSALRAAAAETYRCSWRLLVVNTAVSGLFVAVVIVVSSIPLASLLAPLLAGPIVAALVHCTITLIREEEFNLGDALEGLRLYWRRGLVLGGLFGLGLFFGVLAVAFYGSAEHRLLPLAFVAIYALALFCLFMLVVWPLAIADPDARLSTVLLSALRLLVQRPRRFLALGAILLFVNMLGALAVLPLLTLTIAYSFLVAAHLVLPHPATTEEATA
jgi:hypothetical protein